jgi:hypothetical protein
MVAALLVVAGPALAKKNRCPLRFTSVEMHCRDGSPRCDLDLRCDGTCTLAICEGILAPCVPPYLRLCLPKKSPQALRFLPVGGGIHSRAFSVPGVWTTFRVRCQRARKRCIPHPPDCLVTLGDGTAPPVPCRVDLIDAHDGSAAPVMVRFQSDALAGSGTLTLPVLAPGSFALGAGLAEVQLEATVDGRLYRAAGPGSPAGSVTLEIETVLPSVTVYQRGHGRIEATLDGGPDVPSLTFLATF